ncbi:MAG: hypothetical protein ABL894_12015 [Hyphomicrobium sp.]
MRSIVIAAIASIAIACAAPALAQSDTPAADPAMPAASTAPPASDAAAPEAPAAAPEPAYVGTWADDPAQCGNAQDNEDAPMTVAKDRFDQHEAHCEFKSVSGNGNEWKVTSECSVEGDKQIYEFGMSLADGKLSMLDDAGTHVYARCQ